MQGSLVIIPTYNEKENIAAIIEKALSISPELNILVVEDNSPDGTADIVKKIIAEESRVHILERKGKLGLGTAYIAGFKYGIEKGYKFIIEMDADFSHPPTSLPDLYGACANDGFDVAVGSRYINGVNVVNWPMNRVLMSYFASYYVRFITGMPLRDATAGFVCYSTDFLKSINLDKIKFVGYAFQIEMKFTAWLKGCKIKEVPIIFTDRTKGESKMNVGIFKEAFFGVIALKLKSLFKSPDSY